MKKTRVFLACLGIIAAVLFMGTAPAYSSGYPALGLYMTGNPEDISVVVVGKFDSSFNPQDVDAFFSAAMSLVGGSLPGVTVLGPSQLAQYGSPFNDADSLKAFVKSAYQGLGIDLYIFLDATKVNSVEAQYGKNVRINAWVADMASEVGFTGDYLYATSIEVPELYLQLLSQLSM